MSNMTNSIKKSIEKHSLAIQIGYIGFIVVMFFVSYTIGLLYMQSVYGYEFNLTKGPYAEVMNETTHAADMWRGWDIDNYMAFVTANTCHTLNNVTAEKECLNLI